MKKSFRKKEKIVSFEEYFEEEILALENGSIQFPHLFKKEEMERENEEESIAIVS